MPAANRASSYELPGPIRSEFPVTASRAYLLSGALAPASRTVTSALEDWIRAWTVDPAALWDERFAEWEAVRERLALLLGVTAGSIAIVDGTSRASNLAVGLLAQRRTGNVVVDATTYKSSLFPWLLPERAGLEVRRAVSRAGAPAAAPEDFEPLIDSQTVAVSITHVDPSTGFRHDLRPIADLAHSRGSAFIVDVAQSAGIVPLDLIEQGVDLAAGTAMKWLLGPPGIGYLYVSEALLAVTGAPQVGYLGADLDPSDSSRLRLRPGARRHELGLASLIGLPGFRAGLDLVLAIGVPRIAAHVEGLLDRCFDGVRALGLETTTRPDRRSRAGMLVIPVQHPSELHAFLRQRRVDVWSHEVRGFVRVDPHLFNTSDDIDRFLDGMETYLSVAGAEATRRRASG